MTADQRIERISGILWFPVEMTADQRIKQISGILWFPVEMTADQRIEQIPDIRFILRSAVIFPAAV